MFAKDTSSGRATSRCSNSVTVDTSLLHPRRPLPRRTAAAVVKAAAPDLTSLYVGEHIQFRGAGAVGTGRGQDQLRPRSASAAASARAAPARPPARRRDARQRQLDPQRHRSPAPRPTADFAFWYTNAKPGTQLRPAPRPPAPRPAFEGTSCRRHEQQRRHDQPDARARATAASTTTSRRTRPTCSGELSWNNTTKKLTVKGALLHRRLGGGLQQRRQRVRRPGDALRLRNAHGQRHLPAVRCGLRRPRAVSPRGTRTSTTWGSSPTGRPPREQRRARELPAYFQGSLYATNTVDLGSVVAVRRPDGGRHLQAGELGSDPTSSPRSPRCPSAGRATRPSTRNPSLPRTIRGRACSPRAGDSRLHFGTFTASRGSSVFLRLVASMKKKVHRSGSRARFYPYAKIYALLRVEAGFALPFALLTMPVTGRSRRARSATRARTTARRSAATRSRQALALAEAGSELRVLDALQLGYTDDGERGARADDHP